MYWTDWNRGTPKIEVANMDGTNRKVFVESDLRLPNGLTVDLYSSQVCWGDAGEWIQITYDKGGSPRGYAPGSSTNKTDICSEFQTMNLCHWSLRIQLWLTSLDYIRIDMNFYIQSEWYTCTCKVYLIKAGNFCMKWSKSIWDTKSGCFILNNIQF